MPEESDVPVSDSTVGDRTLWHFGDLVYMKLYRWDSFTREFKSVSAKDYMPSGERVMLMSLQVSKGERVSGSSSSGERLICLLRGAWSMKIAGSPLVVRRNEAVIIPLGFEHSAEAIEDSFALDIVREQEAEDEAQLWGV